METMPKVIGDLLKAEADRRSRVGIFTEDDVKIGQPVKWTTRGEYLIALSDVEHGKVLIQPHNCTINLDNVAAADIAAKTVKQDDGNGNLVDVPLTVEILKQQGDKYGIKYIGTPIPAPPAPAPAPAPAPT